MNKTLLPRVFVIGDRELPDPCPNGSLEDVRRALSPHHPEIINAEFGAGVIDGERVRYVVNAKIGIKG